LRAEKAQEVLLKELKILPFDERLRSAREAARDLFERAWSAASSQGMDMSEAETAGLYEQCLVWSLGLCGINIPKGILTSNDMLSMLVKEALP